MLECSVRFCVWYFGSRWFDYIPFSIGSHTRLTVLVSSYSRVCRSMLHNGSHRGLSPISPVLRQQLNHLHISLLHGYG